MVNLRYSSGNIISPQVHLIGVLALGSHLENHGAALPIDTDAKIASYLALQASLKTGAKYLGVIYAATEYDYVKHGKHVKPELLMEDNLKPIIQTAKKYLGVKKIVIVNAHGGNIPIKSHLKQLENDLEIEIIFNNKIVEIEGAHACTGELSMGALLGIVDTSRLEEHCNFTEYPEVGMVGLKEAREASKEINMEAEKVEDMDICIDLEKGKHLIETALEYIIKDIASLI